jgi:uncharacterized alkaline shock family protein YloU
MLSEFSFQEFWDQSVRFCVDILDYASDGWVLGFIALFILLLIVLFYFSNRQPPRIRAFNNEKGYVEISRGALTDIIRSTSEQVDIEKKPGVTIRNKRGKLHIDVKIRLLPTRRLSEVSDILQRHLTETLEQGLGIRRLGNINIIVVGVRVKTGKDVRASLPLFREKKDKKESPAALEIADDDSSEADSTNAPSDSIELKDDESEREKSST